MKIMLCKKPQPDAVSEMYFCTANLMSSLECNFFVD